MSFWRKLNKAVFSISLVAACIAVIAGSIWGFNQKSEGIYGVAAYDNSWLGIVILLGGAILILVLFSAWGILLEFLDNVADIRNAVCKGQHMTSGQQTYSSQHPLLRNSTPNNITPRVSGWKCPRCGIENSPQATRCAECDEKRPSLSSANVNPTVYVSPQPVSAAPQPVSAAPQPVSVAPQPVFQATPQEAPQAEAVYNEQDFVFESWNCPSCGRHNEGDSNFCYNCGNPRK